MMGGGWVLVDKESGKRDRLRGCRKGRDTIWSNDGERMG